MRTALITRFSALGDVAMTIPAVYSACRCYPDVRFVMVTRPGLTRLFINAPSNLEVIGADVNGEYAGVNGMRRLASKLVKDYHPDVMIDLHHVIRTRLLTIFLRLRGVPAVHLIGYPLSAQLGKLLPPRPALFATLLDLGALAVSAILFGFVAGSLIEPGKSRKIYLICCGLFSVVLTMVLVSSLVTY